MWDPHYNTVRIVSSAITMYSLVKCCVLLSLVLVASQTTIEDSETDVANSNAEILPETAEGFSDGTQQQETLDSANDQADTVSNGMEQETGDTQEDYSKEQYYDPAQRTLFTSTIDAKDDNEAKSQSSCVCKDRVNKALIKSLKSCTDVLDAIQNCKSPRAQTAPSASMMSSCQCSDKVTAALTTALKSCTDAVSATISCGGGSVTGSSCAEIKRNYPRSTSGYYNLVINGRTVNSYCNMDRLCGSGGGWTRLGKLDMTNSSMSCPSGLQQHTVNGIRLCALRFGPGCVSVKIPSNGLRYSQVCGRVRGYQRHTPDAFHRSVNINGRYVDGVSITRGSPRKHVWSLGAGYSEKQTNTWGCPCNTGVTSAARPPSFVGSDYYCESAVPSGGPANRFYTQDPLWDGRLCRSREVPCCRSSLLPWFNKNIGTTTTDFIELRMCVNQGLGDENVAIDQYELYVK